MLSSREVMRHIARTEPATPPRQLLLNRSDLGCSLDPSEAVRRRDETTLKERLLRAAYRSDAGLFLYLGGLCHEGIEESLLLVCKIRGRLLVNVFQLTQLPFYSFELRV